MVNYCFANTERKEQARDTRGGVRFEKGFVTMLNRTVAGNSGFTVLVK